MRGVALRISLIILSICSGSLGAADLPNVLDILGGGKSPGSTQELKPVARWSGLPGWATSVTFSNDDSKLAIGTKNRIQIMDIATKTEIRAIQSPSGQVRSLMFSPDGQLLASGSYQKANLLSADTGDVVRELKGHRAYVTGVAFSPDGKRLATSCEDELVRVWDVSVDAPPVILKGHNEPIYGIAWSPDGTLVASAAGDETRPTRPGEVRLWDAATGQMKQKFELHQKAATGVAFSPDGHFLLSSSIDEHVNVYDLVNNKPLGYFAGHSRPTNAIAVHPDGETAVSVSGGRAVGKNELFLWEFESGETVASVEAHEGKILALAVSHNGRLVASASQDQSVVLWNTAFLATGIPEVTRNEKPAETQQAAQAQQAATAAPPRELRAGIIGLDTSHAGAFTKTLNANPPVAEARGCRVVAAYPKGSPDIKSSLERVPGYTEEVKAMGVEIVDSIDELLKRVDVILLETNDGRPHLEQVLPCLKAGKPCFIDKPIAGSLTDAVAIFEAAKKYNVPVFSSSSLRFGKNSLAVRAGSLGRVERCETTGPAHTEPTHPDLFWYGIHGTESLFTVMGTGCESVVRGKTADGKIEVIGQWSNGRVGIYREGPGYQGTAVGEKGEAPVGSYDGYDPLVFAIVSFFHTGKPPVTPEETLEIYAFMEAADESKRQNGASVTLESVLVKARAEAAKKLAELLK